MSPDQNATSRLRQTMLDYMDETLKEQNIPPEVRQSALQEFDQAMTDAKDNPKPPATILAEWQESAESLREQLEAMQKNGDISATESSDLSRSFDNITQTLETLQQPPNDASAEKAEPTALPQGMPQEVAAALAQKHDV